MAQNIPTKIQIKRGTSLQWLSNDDVLASGEFALETDTQTLKIGNGTAKFSTAHTFEGNVTVATFLPDEYITNFSDTARTTVQTTSGGTAEQPYVIVVGVDSRSSAERTAGPAEIDADISTFALSWNGTVWKILGAFRGPQGLSVDGVTKDAEDNIQFTIDGTNVGSPIALPQAATITTGGGSINFWEKNADGSSAEYTADSFTLTKAMGSTVTFVAATSGSDLLRAPRTWVLSNMITGDVLKSPEVPVPLVYRRRLQALAFEYNQGGNIELRIYDGSDNLIAGPDSLDAFSSDVHGANFSQVFGCPDTTEVYFTMTATGTVAKLRFDDVFFTPDVTNYVFVPEIEENVFSARIVNNAGTVSIGEESTPFIASATFVSEGRVNIVFTTDFFSEAPNVVATNQNGGPEIMATTAVSATGCTIIAHPRGTGNVNTNFYIMVQRQGSDYKEPSIGQRQVAFQDLAGAENEFTADVSATSVISKQTPSDDWIASCSDNGTVYTIVFKTGFFTQIPSITVTPQISNRFLTLTSVSTTGCVITSTTGSCRFTIKASRTGTDYKSPFAFLESGGGSGDGGGGGALNLYEDGSAETALPDSWSVFGFGSASFIISKEPVDLINGTATFKLSSFGVSDIAQSAEIPIPLGYRNRLLSLKFPFRNDNAGIGVDVFTSDGGTTQLASLGDIPASQSSTIGSDTFQSTFYVGDYSSIYLTFTKNSGSNSELLWDDVVITPDPLLTLPNKTITGGNNVFSLSKYNSSNDDPATSVFGSDSGSATLTEGTDYEDGSEWIESITTSSAVNVITANSSASMTYVITSLPNIFDETSLPQVNLTKYNRGLPSGLRVTTHYGYSNDFSITSIVFTSNKLVITINADYPALSGSGSGTAVAPTINFGIEVTKTAGFEPVSLNTQQTVVTYNETIDQENEYTLKIAAVPGAAISDASPNASGWTRSVSANIVTVIFTGTTFTTPPIIDVQPLENECFAGVAGVTTTQFTYRVNNIFTNAVSPQKVNITVKRAGADIRPPIQTGTYITNPVDPVGTIKNSILTLTQFTSQTLGEWILMDGRSIAGSQLATLTGLTTAPDSRGRYLANAGTDGTAPTKTNRDVLGDQNKAHTHSLPGTFVADAGGTSTNIFRPIGTTNSGSEGGNEARPFTLVVNMFIKIND